MAQFKIASIILINYLNIEISQFVIKFDFVLAQLVSLILKIHLNCK